MWWTPEGERVLRGAEWELFREGLDATWDLVEDSMNDPDLFSSGVEAFDGLQPHQKLALLALVGKALKDEAEPRPELTAHTEATVAAIFRHIAEEVVCEIDLAAEPGPVEDATSWRRLVLAAYREAEERDRAEERGDSGPRGDRVRATPSAESDGEDDAQDEPWILPPVDSENVDDWEALVEDLANRILWEDDDYEMGDVFLDADPAEGRARMRLVRIEDDYFTALAPDPTGEQLEPIRRLLRSLSGRPER